MRSLTAFVSTAALVLVTAQGAFAQAQPDFSGTWMLDPASAPAGPAGGGPPRQLTLTQDTDTLAMSWTQNGSTTTMTYNLDGAESRNQEVVSRATWEGNRLVIVTPHKLGGNEIEQRNVFSMDGDDLVIETERLDLQGGEPTVVRLVFNKR